MAEQTILDWSEDGSYEPGDVIIWNDGCYILDKHGTYWFICKKADLDKRIIREGEPN